MSGRAGPAPRPVGWAGHGDLGASLALIVPLMLAYGVGALATGAISAVDAPTRALWAACGRDRDTYLLVYAGVAAAFLIWLSRSGRRSALRVEVVAPLVLEAAIYAMTLAAVIDVVLRRVLGMGAGDQVVAAIGAGVHEELVFRLGALAAGALLLGRLGLPRRLAWTVALIGSSLLFAAAHHWAGEPWDQRAFAFRGLAGLAFALVFWYRSLAHAVWAHVLYDLYVLLVPR